MLRINAMTLVLCGASAFGVAASAQYRPAQSPAPPSSAQTVPNPILSQNDATPPQQETDKEFLHKAAEGGMMEVQLGQLAADKATDPEVKAFGQKMVTDHSALNASMKPIAERMGVKVPDHLNRKDQGTYNKMNALSGTDFDKAYVKDMVMDHHQDLRAFGNEAKTVKDPELKAAVEHGHDVIKEHSEMIDKMAEDKGWSASKHR